MVKALQNAGGMVYHAAAALGVAPKTVYERMHKSPVVAQAIADARGEFMDDAESALKAAVKAGEAWAVCFALKCQGKDRGYIERAAIEHSGPGGGPIETVSSFTVLWPGDKQGDDATDAHGD